VIAGDLSRAAEQAGVLTPLKDELNAVALTRHA